MSTATSMTTSASSRTYVEARDVATAVAAMSAGARPIAGGTDLVVGARHGKAPLPAALVGIHRIPGLGDVAPTDGGGLRIGALVTHATLMADPTVLASYPGLADASAIVGSHATRANGTLGGNVMNSSPAMDTGAPLLCHGGVAVLVGPVGERRVALADLWTGPGRSTAAPDELLVAVELDALPAGGASGSSYVRLQYRRQMEIAIVGAGAVVTLGADGTVTGAKVAITALAPVIHRVAESEAALVGTDGGFEAAKAAGAAAAAAARPISDVRGSADYRRAMAAVITRRAVLTAVRRARGESVPVPASDTTFGS
ncbi:MAG: FAD binding domain-containing protein [Actinobacteria bacterium]|nr:FAD binding domain-containing protein [Actinomycetota bacterium]